MESKRPSVPAFRCGPARLHCKLHPDQLRAHWVCKAYRLSARGKVDIVCRTDIQAMNREEFRRRMT